jgi:lipopolysaccharide assembly outer membrane protein LptD (OstA)
MKSVLFLSAILGVLSTQQILPRPSGLGPAQTGQAETSIGLVTDDATNDPDGVLRHANKARFTIGTVQLTADEVDFNRATGEYVLRGDVRILTGRTR